MHFGMKGSLVTKPSTPGAGGHTNLVKIDFVIDLLIEVQPGSEQASSCL